MVGTLRLGGSVRQLPDRPALFSQALPWAMLFWMFFRQHVYRSDEVYLLVGDEVVATKAGKHTHGLTGSFPVCMASRCQGWPSSRYPWSASSNGARSRFTSSRSCAGRRKGGYSKKPKADAKKQGPSTAQRRPGRPKGSKNTPKAEGAPHAGAIAPHRHARSLVAGDRRGDLVDLFARTALRQPPRSADGATEESASDFLLRCDAALYFPYVGPYSRAGAPSQIWQQGGLRIHTFRAIPQRDYGGGTHPDSACTRQRTAPTKGSHSR